MEYRFANKHIEANFQIFSMRNFGEIRQEQVEDVSHTFDLPGAPKDNADLLVSPI